MSALPPLLARAQAALGTGRYADARADIERHLREATSPDAAALGWAPHVNVLRMCGELDRAVTHGERYIAAARAEGRRAALADCLRVLATAESNRTERRRVEALLDEALALTEADGLVAIRARTLRALALHRMRLGRFHDAAKTLRRAFVAAREAEADDGLAWCYLLQARLERGLGQLALATRVVDEAVRRFDAIDHPYGACQAHLSKVMIALSQGDAVAARQAVDAALSALPRISSPQVEGLTHNEAGEVARLEGDLAAARAHYAIAIDRLGPWDSRVAVPRCNLALVRHALGDRSTSLDADFAEARRCRRPDIEAILHALSMTRAAGAADAAGFDASLRRARLLIAETRLREPDLAALGREAAEAWLSASPPDPSRAARATDFAAQQGATDLDAITAALREAGAPAPLGRFLGGAPLGRGGMGVVLDAVDAEGGAAAVKVLRRDVAGRAGTADRFAKEMEAIAGLDHPAIIRVLAFGRCSPLAAALAPETCTADAPWLALERLDGGTLRPWLGGLDWPAIRSLLLELLDALAHAHARDVLHLDLKPDNILLVGAHPTDGVRLADFGLALLGERARAGVAGTLGYMAPEQLAGRDLGPWTDLFALGATAWALVTGADPYRRDSIEDFAAAVQQEEPGAWSPAVAVPARLREWLDGLLRSDPTRRFRRAADAARALRALGEACGDAPARRTADSMSAPTLLPDDPVFDLPLPVSTPAPLAPAPGSAPVSAPPMWPPARATSTTAPELVPFRRGPLLPRPGVQAALWARLRDVLADGRGRALALVGPEGSGRRTVARALVEVAREHGLADAGGEGSVRIEQVDSGAAPGPRTLVIVRATAPVPGVETVRMPRPDTAHLAAMLQALTPLAPRLAWSLAERADGSPRLARALLDQLVQRGALAHGEGGLVAVDAPPPGPPRSVRRAAEAELERLCPTVADRDALLVAAALVADAQPLIRSVWVGVLGRDPDALVTRAATRGVLQDAGGGALRFRRPDVVWVLQSAPRARQAHARVAAWLAAHHGDPANVGRHLAHAHDWEAALDTLLGAPAADPLLLRRAVDRLGLAADAPRRRRAEARG